LKFVEKKNIIQSSIKSDMFMKLNLVHEKGFELMIFETNAKIHKQMGKIYVQSIKQRVK
jgi:hypothetical protein